MAEGKNFEPKDFEVFFFAYVKCVAMIYFYVLAFLLKDINLPATLEH